MADAAQKTRASFARHGAKLRRVIHARQVASMNQAVAFLAAKAQQLLSGNQSTVSLGRYRWGTNPSFPGAPPKKVSGGIAGSIKTDILQPTPTRVVGRVGTNERKAKSLEYGATIPSRRAYGRMLVFQATTQQGRRTRLRETARGFVFRRYVRGFTLRPRPWLKPLLAANANQVMEFLRNIL